MNDEDRRLKRELYQIQQIRELNDEELQIEEVESLPDDSDDDDHHNGRAKGSMGEFKFDTCLASLHTYLGGRGGRHPSQDDFCGQWHHSDSSSILSRRPSLLPCVNYYFFP